jgi:ABC-type arginine transport system ATPase subunit
VPEIDESALISADAVCQHFGEGDARTQILFDVCIDVVPGQLVIMTGPPRAGSPSRILVRSLEALSI